MITSGVSLPAGQFAALTAKILPPAPPPSIIARPALEHRLAEALGRRLTSVVAGAGFGKSTLLSGWASGVNCAWYTLTADDADLGSLLRGVVQSLRLRLPSFPPEITAAVDGIRGPGADTDEVARAQAWAGLLSDALQQRLRRDLVLVLDDVHEVDPASPSARLIEALSRQAPGRLHLVLASRREPPFPIERLRGQGQVLEIAGSELAFTLDEVTALLEDSLEGGAREVAGGLLEATGGGLRRYGWPSRRFARSLRAIGGKRSSASSDRKVPSSPTWPRRCSSASRSRSRS